MSITNDSPVNQLECFIPYLFDDLVEMCLADGHLNTTQQALFREFCTILTAYNKFKSHHSLRSLDKDYALFNPDLELKQYSNGDSPRDCAAERVVNTFCHVATEANYRPLSTAEMQESFSKSALIKLNTAVDLDEYCSIKCYVRGTDQRTFTHRNWRLQQVNEPVDIWRRVLLLLQFKDDSELNATQLKHRKKAPIPYQAGKIYLYQYKEAEDTNNHLRVVDLPVAAKTLDYWWDNAFCFNNSLSLKKAA